MEQLSPSYHRFFLDARVKTRLDVKAIDRLNKRRGTRKVNRLTYDYSIAAVLFQSTEVRRRHMSQSQVLQYMFPGMIVRFMIGCMLQEQRRTWTSPAAERMLHDLVDQVHQRRKAEKTCLIRKRFQMVEVSEFASIRAQCRLHLRLGRSSFTQWLTSMNSPF